MANQQATGIKRLINAFRYSIKGFKAAWQNEEAFRQECVAALVMLPAAIWLGQTVEQQALLILSFLLIPLTELMNSAVEAIVDRVGTEHHELSGRAKDVASAAVMLSMMMVCVVWGLIIADQFFH
ncbi:MAG: diacylglycerol kinase [Methylococcales bacterium]|nr:diacylglycerol kinase [Methylococcales bacterium]MBT7408153.1 diacylglycerol kinase [Methylococcales bacterium]